LAHFLLVRLGILAPLVESVPPTGYGGTERVVSWLVEELVRRGHDVTLFASSDSRTKARLAEGSPRALRLSGIPHDLPYHLVMLARAFERSSEFDLIHANLDYLALPFAELVQTPVVHTLHGRLDLPWQTNVYRSFPEALLVSISNAQRAPLTGIPFAATVYHGMPKNLFRFRAKPEGHLLFLGRVSPEKGPVFAIEAAKLAGVPLKIAAKVDNADRAFYEREVEPLLDPPRVEYIGEVDDARKQELLGGARALLLPIDWPEPFGLTFIEALACGTPVITRPCGSAPEIVRPGTNGILATDVESLARAIGEVDRIDRRACRADFEERFTVERMADDYEVVYRRILETRTESSRREAFSRVR
jgi:glycosyltransferase involved in cell wall biosynthesis